MAVFIRCFLVIFFLCQSLISQAQNEGFNPNEDQRGTRIEFDLESIFLGFRNRSYEDISDKIFDKVSTFDVGIGINDYTTIIGQVRRKVYDHTDGTYSVADFFGVKGVVAPGTNFELLELPLYTAIGGEFGSDFVHIRNLDHKPNPELGEGEILKPDDPWYLDLWHGARAQWFGARYIVDLLNGTWNLGVDSFRSPNDEFQARYKDPLDLILPPFRLPLTVREFEAMLPGEIYSYTIMGAVFWVAGVGWREGPWTANYGLNFFWRRAFRVTVMKEKNGVMAKIRVTDLADRDKNLGLSGNSLGGKLRYDTTVIDGAFFGSDLKGSIIPVRQSSGDTDIAFEDEVYRYDMRTKEGVEAYEDAVLGKFVVSAQLAAEARKNNGGPVQLDYTRHTETDSHAEDTSYNILIWKHQKKFQLDNTLMTITDADGVNHVFKSVSRNEVKNGNLFRNKEEETIYLVDTTFELEKREHQTKALEPSVNMSILITDKHAYGYQVREYFQNIENILQNPSFFNEAQYDLEDDYRKLSILFEVRFYLRAIDYILAASEDMVWTALAKAYGIKPEEWSTPKARDQWVPWYYYVFSFRVRDYAERVQIYEDAKKMADYFLEIKKEKSRKKRAELLAEFHHEMGFEHRLMTIMLLLAHPDHVFYKLEVRGSKIPEVTQAWGKEIVFERPDNHENDDKELEGQPLMDRGRVSNVRVTYDATDQKFKLLFETPIDPNTIDGFYLNISRVRGWWFRNKKLYLTTDLDQLYKEFSWNGNTVAVDLTKLSDSFLFDVDYSYELSFAFMEKGKTKFSVEPKLVFKYKEDVEIKPQWMNIDGKSRILGY